MGGLLAVRFFWMNLFVLLWLAHLQGIRGASYRAGPWLGMGVAVALLWGVVQHSSWTVLAPRGGIDRYLQTFDGDRYHAHTVWFLREAGVEGKLFNAYSSGGFLEYWLLPKLSVFVDGSLNFPSEVLADYETIQTLGGRDTGLDPAARLEAHGVDFFVGTGLPIEPLPGRPWRYTTSHLARHPDWLLVYRSLRGAVYMRRSPRNDENLNRIERYYDRYDVPFDRVDGLDVNRSLCRLPARLRPCRRGRVGAGHGDCRGLLPR